MSRRVEVKSIDEMMSKKCKRSKGKEAQSSQPEHAMEAEPTVVEQLERPSTGALAEAKGKKPWADVDEDPNFLHFKVPRGTSVLTDPSGLQSFVGGLLFEEDEERMTTVGPAEAAKKAITRAYEVCRINT